ncbi:hypothetical protein AEA09_00685 [Lysinibacillus contaminans]|uniref:Small, acid-soluble spore protein gamma-type n=1 Tax=Lysinibacillus contaminans TaxID=1293441 RepID=A0ABR5K568_9BACI|nr:hypothetical protein [Lysinibacillus contaminans]KOS71557.1 hypothetical protein AEA09_00685 [Lysinibacillus contaminans]
MKRNQNNNSNQSAQKQNSQQRQVEEFGSETDFADVQQQNQKAEAKKSQASGQFAKKNQNNSSNN